MGTVYNIRSNLSNNEYNEENLSSPSLSLTLIANSGTKS